jgi:hypothetical protein
VNLLTHPTTVHIWHSTGETACQRIHSDPLEAPVPLLNRIRSFLATPQGRRLTDQGRRYASDPRRQRQVRDLMARLRRR